MLGGSVIRIRSISMRPASTSSGVRSMISNNAALSSNSKVSPSTFTLFFDAMAFSLNGVEKRVGRGGARRTSRAPSCLATLLSRRRRVAAGGGGPAPRARTSGSGDWGGGRRAGRGGARAAAQGAARGVDGRNSSLHAAVRRHGHGGLADHVDRLLLLLARGPAHRPVAFRFAAATTFVVEVVEEALSAVIPKLASSGL